MSRRVDLMAKLSKAVSEVSKDLDADVVVYNGGIEHGCEHRLQKQINSFKSRPNLALFLTTGGGLPDTAYRLARCIQRHYKQFILLVNSYCKSGGTLISVGADQIVLFDMAELGPLDIQIAKHDELIEYVSGLTPVQALATLRAETFKAFEEFFISIVEKSLGQITTMSAAQLATKLTTECFSSIYQQIDPMRLGEYERAMDIMYHYGLRLDRGNLKEDSLLRLIVDYPSHGFVIDRLEAEELFREVRRPNQHESDLSELLRGVVSALQEKSGEIVIEFLGPRSRILPDSSKGSSGDARKDHKPKDGRSVPTPLSPGSDLEDPPRPRGTKLVPERPEADKGRKSAPKPGNRRGIGRNGKSS